ncbi:response regulator [Spirosoma aerophilum]
MSRQRINQVVLVDDDPDYIYLVERALEDCVPACNLKVLFSGSALLEWLETDPVRPNLILLDINMPISNGFEVLNVLRSVDRYKMIPVVMLSNSESKEDIGKSYDRGANAYLVKPAGFSELKRRLDFFNHYWFDISKTPSANWGDINWYNELN